MYEDLRWFGFDWQEGPDVGGPFAPYSQSDRMPCYRSAFEKLKAGGFVYACTCSRKDIAAAARAPHAEDDAEPIYPGTCRANPKSEIRNRKYSWRFRIPDGESVAFTDGNLGPQAMHAGRDFGDFVVWRQDDFPAYQLACVADDAAMGVTEVVRGADLLVSTARQLLLYHALGLTPPQFFHCELMRDKAGVRLAKRYDALSLRELKARGKSPAVLRAGWNL